MGTGSASLLVERTTWQIGGLPMAPDPVLQYPHELAKVHVLAWQPLETANVPPFVLRTAVGDPL